MAVPFRHAHRVSYAECTIGNHVYYARYLDYLETTRGAFFRELGASFWYWQERETSFPVVECRLVYKSPARYDDLLDITVWPAAIGRARLDFAYRVVNQTERLILEAETHHVCAGPDGRPKRIPEELAERLKPYLDTLPTAI